MTKATVSMAAILALLTVLVLGQIGLLAMHAGTPAFSESSPSSRELATVRSFYDGLNHLLASGDRSIETTVAPGFVDHTRSAQGDRTLPQMIDWLLAVRATLPHMQVTVMDIEPRDQLLAVRLKVVPGALTPIPGIPMTPVLPFQTSDLLRVEGVGITDRWSVDTQLPVVSSSVHTDVVWNARPLAVPAVEHFSLDPWQSTQIPLSGRSIVGVESGSVQLDRAGTDLDGNNRPQREPLDSGKVRILQGDGELSLRNADNVAAEIWVFRTGERSPEPGASGDTAPDSAHGFAMAFMPLLLDADALGNPQNVSITQITVPPGATIAPHSPGVTEAMVVLDGTLDVTVRLGRALKCTGASAQPFDGTETVFAGEGVSAKGTASLGYRVAGAQPATLLIVRIDPPSSVHSEWMTT